MDMRRKLELMRLNERRSGDFEDAKDTQISMEAIENLDEKIPLHDQRMFKLLALLENYKYGAKVAMTHKDELKQVKDIMAASMAVTSSLRKKELQLLQEEYRNSMKKVLDKKNKDNK